MWYLLVQCELVFLYTHLNLILHTHIFPFPACVFERILRWNVLAGVLELYLRGKT